MSCQKYSIKGLERGCRDSRGSIVKVWISNNTEIPAVNMTLDASTGAITHLDTSVCDYAHFKPYTFNKNTGSLTSSAVISEQAGTSFETKLSLTFIKQDTGKRLEMMSLALSDTIAIVKDGNGEYHFLGWDEPIECTALTATTGQNATDGNNYVIEITDNSVELPRIITDASAIAALESIVIV